MLRHQAYEAFCSENVGFAGRVSILAHSLGNVICFDILRNQEVLLDLDSKDQQLARLGQKVELGTSPFSCHSMLSGDDSSVCARSRCSSYSSGINLGAQRLLFSVQTLFGVGSPLGLYLGIRGGLGQSSLTRTRIINIMHPFDPVTYRVDPVFSPQGATSGAPTVIPHWRSGNVRMHMKVKGFFQSAATFMTFGLVPQTSASSITTDAYSGMEGASEGPPSSGAVAASTVDYILQPASHEKMSETISALKCHKGYWAHPDVAFCVMLLL